jgi:hypothetical protein
MKMGAGFRANLFPFEDVEDVEEKAAKAAKTEVSNHASTL